jgi:pyruvate-formate lyase
MNDMLAFFCGNTVEDPDFQTMRSENDSANIQLLDMMTGIRQKKTASVDEAIESLRNKPVKSTMLERLKLIEQADALVKGLPQPLQLGRGLSHILDNASIPVMPHDLLLGRVPEALPDEEGEAFLRRMDETHGGRGRPEWLQDGGHITFAWEMLLEHGISGLAELAEQELAKRRLAHRDSAGTRLAEHEHAARGTADRQKAEPGETHQKQNQDSDARIVFLDGMVLVYRAFQNYIIRYGLQAKNEGLAELAGICDIIAWKPPETFRQAMQLILFVGHAFSLYAAVNSTLTYGRLDDILRPYYLRDTANGIMDRDLAAAIISDFNCKNNLILGRGEHQMSGRAPTDTGWLRNPTYDTPQYVMIGGYSNRHDHSSNPLTEIFLDCITPRFENPVYVFRYSKDVNGAVWEKVCDLLRLNASLLVYNDETEVSAMMRAGIEKKDAVNYTIHGCNWPDIPGDYAIRGHLGGTLPGWILRALQHEGGTPGKTYGHIDEIYDVMAVIYREEARRVFREYRDDVMNSSSRAPLHLRVVDCFMNGTIANANNFGSGCVKYPVVYNTSIRNIGTAADMMAAIDRLLFVDKVTTLPVLLEAMHKDFEGCGALRAECLRTGKFGCDDDFADRHAVRLMKTLLDIIDEESMNDGVRDVHSFNLTITDMGHIDEGKRTMATPDGRKNGMPLSENLSPTAGSATGGVTALMHSLAKLPFDRIHSGAFNLKMRKDWVSGEAGLKRLKNLLATYFELGGMQVQLSVADAAELRDAQAHPEAHRDLMVRITGYSAVFVDMCKSAQDEFIRRDELG